MAQDCGRNRQNRDDRLDSPAQRHAVCSRHQRARLLGPKVLARRRPARAAGGRAAIPPLAWRHTGQRVRVVEQVRRRRRHDALLEGAPVLPQVPRAVRLRVPADARRVHRDLQGRQLHPAGAGERRDRARRVGGERDGDGARLAALPQAGRPRRPARRLWQRELRPVGGAVRRRAGERRALRQGILGVGGPAGRNGAGPP